MIRQIASRLQALMSPPRPSSKDPFLKLVEGFRERLKRWPPPQRSNAPRGKVAVLLTPWLSTGVPLFNLECALMLVRAGYHVSLLCDLTDVVGNAPDEAHGRAIADLALQLQNAGSVEVIDPAAFSGGEPDFETAGAILRNNAIWRMRGEAKASEFLERHPDAEARIAAHLGRIEQLLRGGFDWLFLPGGIFGISGVYVAAARKVGLAFTTYDAAVGVLRLAQDAIAAHLGDLPRAFAALRPGWLANSEEKRRVLALAESEIGDRSTARDFRHFQVAPATGHSDLRYDVLVPLNIRWDSAALARQRIFDSVRDWLRALLEWGAAHPSVTICIRQHPRERLDFARGSDDWETLLGEFAVLGERVRFVRADDEINTYDLLQHAKVVLPHTSTIGIEAAFLGKPVVLATTCYYENLGFVWQAATREEYFARIGEALAGALPLSGEQREDAGFAYFLTQRCAFVRTEFNPNGENFVNWVRQSPKELWAVPENEDVRTALLAREPFSAVRYRRLVRE